MRSYLVMSAITEFCWDQGIMVTQRSWSWEVNIWLSLNVATVEVRFGAVVLIEKLVFNVAYEKIGVAGSHFLHQRGTQSISFKRDKNIGNFLVRSAFQTSEQPGTFKCARARCKTCPFICNVEKLSGPKRSIKITDHFTCTSANVIYCITCTLCKKLYISAKQVDD